MKDKDYLLLPMNSNPQNIEVKKEEPETDLYDVVAHDKALREVHARQYPGIPLADIGDVVVTQSRMLTSLGCVQNSKSSCDGLMTTKIIPAGTMIGFYHASSIMKEEEIAKLYGVNKKEMTFQQMRFPVEVRDEQGEIDESKVALPTANEIEAARVKKIIDIYRVNHADSIKLLQISSLHDEQEILAVIKGETLASDFQTKYLNDSEGYVKFNTDIYFVTAQGFKHIGNIAKNPLSIFKNTGLTRKGTYRPKDATPQDIATLSHALGLEEPLFHFLPNTTWTTVLLNLNGKATTQTGLSVLRDLQPDEELLADYGAEFKKEIAHQSTAVVDIVPFDLALDIHARYCPNIDKPFIIEDDLPEVKEEPSKMVAHSKFFKRNVRDITLEELKNTARRMKKLNAHALAIQTEADPRNFYRYLMDNDFHIQKLLEPVTESDKKTLGELFGNQYIDRETGSKKSFHRPSAQKKGEWLNWQVDNLVQAAHYTFIKNNKLTYALLSKALKISSDNLKGILNYTQLSLEGLRNIRIGTDYRLLKDLKNSTPLSQKTKADLKRKINEIYDANKPQGGITSHTLAVGLGYTPNQLNYQFKKSNMRVESLVASKDHLSDSDELTLNEIAHKNPPSPLIVKDVKALMQQEHPQITFQDKDATKINQCLKRLDITLDALCQYPDDQAIQGLIDSVPSSKITVGRITKALEKIQGTNNPNIILKVLAESLGQPYSNFAATLTTHHITYEDFNSDHFKNLNPNITLDEFKAKKPLLDYTLGQIQAKLDRIGVPRTMQTIESTFGWNSQYLEEFAQKYLGSSWLDIDAHFFNVRNVHLTVKEFSDEMHRLGNPLSPSQAALLSKKTHLWALNIQDFKNMNDRYRTPETLADFLSLPLSHLEEEMERFKKFDRDKYNLYHLTLAEKEKRYVKTFLTRDKQSMNIIEFHLKNVQEIRIEKHRQDYHTRFYDDYAYMGHMSEDEFADLLNACGNAQVFQSIFQFDKDLLMGSLMHVQSRSNDVIYSRFLKANMPNKSLAPNFANIAGVENPIGTQAVEEERFFQKGGILFNARENLTAKIISSVFKPRAILKKRSAESRDDLEDTKNDSSYGHA